MPRKNKGCDLHMKRRSDVASKSKSRCEKKDQFRYVHLTLSGRALDPDRVTESLGIHPSSSCRRGDNCGRNRRAVLGCWSLDGRPTQSRIETQIRSILKRLEPVKREFRALVEGGRVEHAYVTISCTPSDCVPVACYYLPSGLVKELALLGIGVEFSVHVRERFEEAIRLHTGQRRHP